MGFHFQAAQRAFSVNERFNTWTVAIEESVAGNGADGTGTTGGIHIGTVATDAVTNMDGQPEI